MGREYNVPAPERQWENHQMDYIITAETRRRGEKHGELLNFKKSETIDLSEIIRD
jgi:hypothetical protein